MLTSLYVHLKLKDINKSCFDTFILYETRTHYTRELRFIYLKRSCKCVREPVITHWPKLR